MIMSKYSFFTIFISFLFISTAHALVLGDNETTINQPSIDEYSTWRYKTGGLPYKSVNAKNADLAVEASWQGGTLRITNGRHFQSIIKYNFLQLICIIANRHRIKTKHLH